MKNAAAFKVQIIVSLWCGYQVSQVATKLGIFAAFLSLMAITAVIQILAWHIGKKRNG